MNAVCAICSEEYEQQTGVWLPHKAHLCRDALHRQKDTLMRQRDELRSRIERMDSDYLGLNAVVAALRECKNNQNFENWKRVWDKLSALDADTKHICGECGREKE